MAPRTGRSRHSVLSPLQMQESATTRTAAPGSADLASDHRAFRRASAVVRTSVSSCAKQALARSRTTHLRLQRIEARNGGPDDLLGVAAGGGHGPIVSPNSGSPEAGPRIDVAIDRRRDRNDGSSPTSGARSPLSVSMSSPLLSGERGPEAGDGKSRHDLLEPRPRRLCCE